MLDSKLLMNCATCKHGNIFHAHTATKFGNCQMSAWHPGCQLGIWFNEMYLDTNLPVEDGS